MNSPGAYAWLERLLPAPEPVAEVELSPSISDVMAWVIKTMAADGRIDEGEVKIVSDLAAKVRMPLSEVQGMTEAALENELDAPEPAEEQQLLDSLGKSSDLTPYDVRHLINKRRSKIHRQARDRQRSEAPRIPICLELITRALHMRPIQGSFPIPG